MLKIDIVIPSTNGLELFKKHLPAILEYTPNLKNLIIVDNASTDGSISYAKSLSSKVRSIRNDQNNAYTKAINQGVNASTADLVVLLNNDVHPSKGYLDNAIKLLDNPKIFAITFNEKDSSYPLVKWTGKFEYRQNDNKSGVAFSAWASGGSAIFRRSIWKEIGGLNEIYSPGYWEDIDLGWTAWRSGYKILFDPSAKVQHQHESTFGKTNQNKLQLIKQRNELLFNWQHFLDRDHLASHLYFLITHTLQHPGYLKVIILALLKISKLRSLKCLYTSSEVFKMLYDQKELN